MIQDIIFQPSFLYEQPWFYNNKLALRCSLENKRKNPYEIALEISKLLFTDNVDCLFFDQYIYSDKLPESNDISLILNKKHTILKHIEENNIKIIKLNYKDDDDDELEEVNRIFYFSNKIDIGEIINNNFDTSTPIIHLVSLKHNFIFSIYDKRGCDIVFFNEKEFIKYYSILENYLFDYDKKKMKEKFLKLTNSIK